MPRIVHIPGLLVGAFANLGCGLLTPYPGGGDPAEVLGGATSEDGASPIQGGAPQDPLVDPAVDDSVSVVSNEDVIVAIPGESFLVDLTFVAENSNVVGGGIQFPDTDRVQWTLIDGLLGTNSGSIVFAYAVPADLCGQVPSQCHAIETKQFAVARNSSPDHDIDGDGTPDGEFVVSKPAEVTVVLKCASCESESCLEELPGAECSTCTQPPDCRAAYEQCYAPGRPKADTDEGRQFERFLGEEGIAWTTAAGCAGGEEFCRDALSEALADCPDAPEDGEGEGE